MAQRRREVSVALTYRTRDGRIVSMKYRRLPRRTLFFRIVPGFQKKKGL